MKHINQLRGESQHYKLWFEEKKYLKIEQKDKMRFNKVKNYNPNKHCEWHHENDGWIDTFIGL